MIIDIAHTSKNNTGMETNDFTMKASAAAFKIMSSLLYERKEEAVLRELAANALDAHSAVNKQDIPIEITLPSAMNPYLTVKDQGVGMSAATVQNILTSYFSSTKTANSIGLGFKSPFAISEAYTVETVHLGLRTELLISLVDGNPKYIIVTKSAPTDQPDGTVVTVPVDKELARQAMAAAATNLFAYWDVAPIVDGTPFPALKKEKFFDTKHYSVKFNQGNPTIDQVFSKILLGSFVYKIPPSLINRVQKHVDTLGTKQILLFREVIVNNSAILLTNDVGKIKLAPSKEYIEDTDANYEIIKTLVLECIDYGLNQYKAKAVELLRRFSTVVSTATTPLGLTEAQQDTLKKDLIDIAGSSALAENLLNLKILKALMPHSIEFILNLVAHIQTYLYHIGNLWLYVDKQRDIGYLKVLYSIPLVRLNVRTHGVTRYSSYSRYDTPIDRATNVNPLVVVTDAPTLTKQQKAKINYTFRKEGQIELLNNKGLYFTLKTENYCELANSSDLNTFKDIVNNYVSAPEQVMFITYKQLEPYLSTPVKSVSRKRRVANTTKSTLQDSVVGSYHKFYNIAEDKQLPVTCKNLYRDKMFKDLDVIFFVKSRSKNISPLLKVAGQSCKTTPTLLIEVDRQEASTKRFKDYVSSTGADVLTYFHCRDKTLWIKRFMGKDFKDYVIVSYIYCKYGFHSLHEYLPKKYQYVLEKYTHKHLYTCPWTSQVAVDFDPLAHFDDSSDEYAVVKATVPYYSKDIHKLLDAIAKPICKRVVTATLKHATITIH